MWSDCRKSTPRGRTPVQEWRTDALRADVPVFIDSFQRIIFVPATRNHGLTGATAVQHCSVTGPFNSERATLAYCLGYQWTHYASFPRALDALLVQQQGTPERPLIVDIGCGPATALMSFGEWLARVRPVPLDVRYIGIDPHLPKQRIAREFARDRDLFAQYVPVLVAGPEELTQPVVVAEATRRDGIILLLSYVMDQEFMLDGGAYLLEVLRRLRPLGLPVHILSQDALKKARSGPNVDEWPDNRLRGIVTASRSLDYVPTATWSENFRAPKFRIDDEGNAQELQDTTNSTAFKCILQPLG